MLGQRSTFVAEKSSIVPFKLTVHLVSDVEEDIWASDSELGYRVCRFKPDNYASMWLQRHISADDSKACACNIKDT